MGIPKYELNKRPIEVHVVMADASEVEQALHDNAVLFSDSQDLSESQKSQALENIGAAVANGVNVYLVAGDIVPKTKSKVNTYSKFRAQSTGGDADIKTGASKLLDIKGFLDESLRPFNADKMVSTGMNLVDPDQYISIHGARAYYFPCVAGSFGTLGTTQENNGYVIVGATVIEVYFKSTKPNDGSLGAVCPRINHEGRDYYTPEGIGWLTIVCDGAVPACHLAWSNYNDDEAGVFDNTEKDIIADVQWIHSWGMASLSGGGRDVFDEIDVKERTMFRRTDRMNLKEANWAMEEPQNEGPEQVNVFYATIGTMAANGLWACLFAGLEFQGNTAYYRSSDIDSVEDLVKAMDGYLLYFELADTVSTSCTTTEDTMANDFGLTYFMLDGELADVPAYVAESFDQSGKDQLFNAVTYQKILAEVTATALCNLDSRLLAIEDNIKKGFNYLKVTNLEVTRKLTQPA